MHGYLAEVVHNWLREAACGYLEARSGETLTVIYVGTGGDEQGWIYAHRRAVGEEG